MWACSGGGAGWSPWWTTTVFLNGFSLPASPFFGYARVNVNFLRASLRHHRKNNRDFLYFFLPRHGTQSN
jgi:hypothetical protein